MKIIAHFKNWFWPHHGNDHHPHLLRPRGLTVLTVAVVVIQVVFNYTATGRLQVLGYASNINVGDVAAYTNQERSSRGMAGLRLDSRLNQAAYAKAQDMLRDNYWAHTAPDGTQPWHFISQAGYNYSYAGENLAKNFDTSKGVVNAWMASSGHRANILSNQYQDMGIAVVNGELSGEKTTVVVAMYAKPVAKAPAPAPAPTSTVQAQPEPQPAPSPQPEPKPKPKPKPKPQPKPEPEPEVDPQIVAALPDEFPDHQVTELAPEPQAYRPTTLGALREALGWGQFATIWVLSLVAFVNVAKHTVIWRLHPAHLQHVWLRSHPLGQAGLLGLAIVAIIVSSFGVVG